MKALLYYFALINMIAFVTMGIDKSRALRHRWRVPERTLFLLAISGGSLGSLLGMLLFRHKIRNNAFRIGLPVILFLQLILFFVIRAFL